MTPVPASTLDLVWRRDMDRCFRCTRPLTRGYGGYSVHHRRARGMGGSRRSDTNMPSNLILLCGSGTDGCHGWVESNRGAALTDGLLVASWGQPVDTPLIRWGTQRVTLSHDGAINFLPREGVKPGS